MEDPQTNGNKEWVTKSIQLSASEILVIVQALDTHINLNELFPAKGEEETQREIIETAKKLKAELKEQLIEAGYNLWTNKE